MGAEDEISEEQARLLAEEMLESDKAPSKEETPPADESEKLRQELAAMRDQWMRAIAEADNVRKRAKRDQEETTRFATTAFARDMVGVLENLIRASANISLESRREDKLLDTLAEGVDLTRDELLNIFEKYAIKRIDPKGEKFDHNFHQAVVQVENNELEPGTVMEVVQAGYTMHGRLLRPAMVAVSKRSEPPPAIEPVDTLA